MKTANYYHLFSICRGLEDIDETGPSDFNPDDEHSAKRAFERHVKPLLDRYVPAGREMLFRSFSYFLKKGDPNVWLRVLAKHQDLTMSHPDDYNLFFRWMWEVLYPGVDYQTVDTEGVQEHNEAMEVNAMYGIDPATCVIDAEDKSAGS